MQATPSRLASAELLGHQIDVPHGIRAWRRRSTRASCATSAWRRASGASRPARAGTGRRTIRGPCGGRGRGKPGHEIRSQRHVLMEQRGAAGQLLGRVVLEDRSDDRAFRKRGRLGESPSGAPPPLRSFPAIPTPRGGRTNGTLTWWLQKNGPPPPCGKARPQRSWLTRPTASRSSSKTSATAVAAAFSATCAASDRGRVRRVSCPQRWNK